MAFASMSRCQRPMTRPLLMQNCTCFEVTSPIYCLEIISLGSWPRSRNHYFLWHPQSNPWCGLAIVAALAPFPQYKIPRLERTNHICAGFQSQSIGCSRLASDKNCLHHDVGWCDKDDKSLVGEICFCKCHLAACQELRLALC